MPFLRLRRLATIVAITTAGCAQTPASALLSTPKWREGSAKCEVTKSQSEPLIVEWSNEDRARLEALAKKGPVAVKYAGCEMRVLSQCNARGAYGYVATTRKTSVEHIATADELWAKLPFGAARLEGTLVQAGELNVKTTIVGRFAAPSGVAQASALVGDCQEATHVVTALLAGAFEFASGSEASVGASASVFDKGGGAGSKATRRVLTADGDVAACDKATGADTAPPPECGALLQLEVTPLAELRARLAEAERARTAEYERAKERAAARRAVGWTLTTLGVASGAVAGVTAYLGAKKNDELLEGGFATAADMKAAEGTGKALDVAAWACGIAAVPLVGVGVPLIVASPPPRAPSVDAAAAPGGVVVRGAF